MQPPFQLWQGTGIFFEGIQLKILVKFQAERFIDHVGKNKAWSFYQAKSLYKLGDLLIKYI